MQDSNLNDNRLSNGFRCLWMVVLLFLIQNGASIFTMEVIVGIRIFHFHGRHLSELTGQFSDASFISAISTGTYLIYTTIAIVVYFAIYRKRFLPKSVAEGHVGDPYVTPGNPPSLSFRGFSLVKLLPGIVLVVAGMTVIVNYVIAILSLVFPEWLDMLLRLEEMSGLGDEATPLMLYYTVFAGPLTEELALRGVVTEYARRAMPEAAAVVLQALLFGLLHMNPLQISYSFLVGLVLGYLYIKTGNLVVSILLHMLYNAAAIFTAELALPAGPVVTYVIVLGSCVATYLGITLVSRSVPPEREPFEEAV